jgi:hypothetical protein
VRSGRHAPRACDSRPAGSRRRTRFHHGLLLLLCYKSSSPLWRPSAPATGQPLKQRASEEFVHRGDRGGDMPFRPHRERPAA